jgi:DNA-binding beta-propeller fold protein YncE
MNSMLVTSASGANGHGHGHGSVPRFTTDGVLVGPFSQDATIIDPRGVSLHPSGELIYLNSGNDRVLALDRAGSVVLDSGQIDGLDPGGGTFGPDGRYYIAEAQTHDPRLACRARKSRGTTSSRRDRALSEGIRLRTTRRGLSRVGSGSDGEGDNTIAVFQQDGSLRAPRLVEDLELGPARI